MKKVISGLSFALLLLGCTDKNAEEKKLLSDVIIIHDKVMAGDEQVMKNKMLLDSMVSHNSTAETKDSVHLYLSKVNKADSVMGVWMHKFDPAYQGKSTSETINYYTDQKKQIVAIDSQITQAVKESNRYLTKMKMK